MLGKFQKDHHQLIMQTWEYQVKNEKKLAAMDAKLDAIMKNLLSDKEIDEEKALLEDLADSSFTDLDGPDVEIEESDIQASAPFSNATVEVVEKKVFTLAPTVSPSLAPTDAVPDSPTYHELADTSATECPVGTAISSSAECKNAGLVLGKRLNDDGTIRSGAFRML